MLPIFHSVIGKSPSTGEPHVIKAEYATQRREGDLPALAIPNALWRTDLFLNAVAEHDVCGDLSGLQLQELIEVIFQELYVRAR